jgi:hypothetical protein
MCLNVFRVCLNVFECIHSVFEYIQCIYNIFMAYLNVCIVYLNVFECTYSIFVVHFNVSIIYFNALTLELEFHHHILIVTFLPCTPTYTFYFHSIQWLPSQHAIPLHSFFSNPVDPFQLSYNLFLLFTFIHHPTFHIPHSMSSLVARSIAKPKFNMVVDLELPL